MPPWQEGQAAAAEGSRVTIVGSEQVRLRERSPEPLGQFPKSESSASLGDPDSVVLGQEPESVCKSAGDAYELASMGNTCVSDGDPGEV